MKTGKSLTFHSILISYLVLCLAMLTVTIIGYSSSIFYVQKEIRNSAALRMREVVGKIEIIFGCHISCVIRLPSVVVWMILH